VQYEFGFNNTNALKFIIKVLKRENLNVDIFYTGTNIVNSARLTGNSSAFEIKKQRKIIAEQFPASKLFIVANDTVLNDFNVNQTLSKLELLLKESQIDGLIIANPILLHYFNDFFKNNNKELIISTITNLDSVEKVENLVNTGYYFTGIVAPISLNRNIDELEKIKKVLVKRSLTIIPNESCSPNCINRQYHFNAHSINSYEFSNRFVEECSQNISKYPINILKSGILPPSFFSKQYNGIIDIVKLPNRHLENKIDIEKSIKHLANYSSFKNPKDLFSLLTFDYNYYMESSLLNDLFDIWLYCGNKCHSCNACLKYEKLIQHKEKV